MPSSFEGGTWCFGERIVLLVMAAVLVHSLYGESANRGSSLTPATSRPAPPGGAEYVGRGRCKANGDTCEGFPAKGTELCIGHLRALEKAQREQS